MCCGSGGGLEIIDIEISIKTGENIVKKLLNTSKNI